MIDTHLKKLGAQHHKIIALDLEGCTRAMIASELGMTVVNIKNVLDSPLAQAELSRLRKQVEAVMVKNIAEVTITADQILSNNSGVAATAMTKLLISENEGIVQKAAADILDRTGFPKITRSDSTILQTRIVISSKALERIEGVTAALGMPPVFDPSIAENVEIREGD